MVPLHLCEVNGLPGLQRIIAYPWAAYCSYFYHAGQGVPYSWMVHSQDSSFLRQFSQGLSEASETPEHAQG